MLFLFSFWHPYDLGVGTFGDVPEVPKPILVFLNFFFFILFWLNVYLFLMFQIVGFNPGFLHFSVGSLLIILYFTYCTLHFFLYFVAILKEFSEHPDTQCFESDLHLIGWLSLFHLVLFLFFFPCYFIWAIFLCLLKLAAPCVGFCVLGRAAFTPCLRSVTYVGKVPVNCMGWSLR